MQKVKGHPNLVKDEKTGLVKNVNSTELERAKMAKARILSEIEKRKQLESRLDKLEEMVLQLSEKEEQ